MPSCSHSNKAGQGGYKNFDEKHFSCLATVNARESSHNEGALGRIRNHKKRVAQKDHKNFVAVVCLCFVFAGRRLRFRVIPKSTLNTKSLPITSLVLLLGSSSLDRKT